MQKKRHSSASRALLFGLALFLFALPMAAGVAIYFALDGPLLALSELGDVAGPRPTPNPTTTPETAESPLALVKGRVNLLLLGTDRREREGSASRTDTIMVATLDPETRSAGVLSIPRDLWVTVPGYGQERINAAYELGEISQRGRGLDLTRKTVEQLLGVPIHHYVLVGFAGFEKLVDELGGVVLDVERPIWDDEFPDHHYGTRRIFFQPGLQRLDGESALWYVRTRHADSDFGRARRQQQLLLALRAQALQLNMLPKAPSILAAVAGMIKTDVRPPQALALAQAAKEIDPTRVVSRVIDESVTSHWVTPAGAQVELPDTAALQQLVQEVFHPMKS